MRAVLAIARATLPELLRQRLLLVPILAVLLTLAALAAALLVTDGPLDLERSHAEDLAWGAGIAASFGAAIYALIVGASLVAREISDGTLLMLAARPIGRWQVVAGRALGAAVFLVGALLATALAYGLAAAAVSGMLAPLDEPIRAIATGLPGVLLALCVGVAFSIQGKATAAIGSAVGVALFALVVSGYVSQWRAEEHRREYLVDSVASRLPSNDPVVGPLASALVRLMPFGVFASHAQDSLFERAGGGYDRERVDTAVPGGYASSAEFSGPGSGPVDAPAPVKEPDRLPDEPGRGSFQCAEYGGASCFLGHRKAWTRRYLPPPPQLHDRSQLLLAWLAIPLWLGIAMLLLWRRRDLVD